MGVAIVLRWGDTLLEVVHVERGAFAVAGTELVRAGLPHAPTHGRVGAIAYELRADTRAASVPGARSDLHLLPYLVAAAVVHVGLAMWALSTPAPPSTATPRTTQAAHRARIAPAPPPERAEGDDRTGHAGRGEASAVRGAPGATGAPIAAPPRAHVAIANTGEEAQLARAEAISRARRAGILGSAQISPDTFASLIGNAKVTSGFDDHSAEAALADRSDPGGGFAAGRTGLGAGGGGRDGSMIGLGTRGHASEGTSLGHGWGGTTRGTISPRWGSTWQGGDYATSLYLGHHPISSAKIEICPAKYRDRCHVTGVLDPAVVRRYVRRQSVKLTYCYEKQLLADPKVADEVLFLSFAIQGDGTVSAATASLDALATCATEVISGVSFPTGATQIDYVITYAHRR